MLLIAEGLYFEMDRFFFCLFHTHFFFVFSLKNANGKKIGEIFILYLFVLADFTSTENYLPGV